LPADGFRSFWLRIIFFFSDIPKALLSNGFGVSKVVENTNISPYSHRSAPIGTLPAAATDLSDAQAGLTKLALPARPVRPASSRWRCRPRCYRQQQQQQQCRDAAKIDETLRG
jgi:hypothetical protein